MRFSGHDVLGKRVRMDCKTGSVTCVHPDHICVKRDDGQTGGGCEGAWWTYLSDVLEVLGEIETKERKTKTIMAGIREKFALMLAGEPEKTFRKLGITNGDNLLTEDGATVFLSWLLKANGDAFKKEVCDPMVEADKE